MQVDPDIRRLLQTNIAKLDNKNEPTPIRDFSTMLESVSISTTTRNRSYIPINERKQQLKELLAKKEKAPVNKIKRTLQYEINIELINKIIANRKKKRSKQEINAIKQKYQSAITGLTSEWEAMAARCSKELPFNHEGDDNYMINEDIHYDREAINSLNSNAKEPCVLVDLGRCGTPRCKGGRTIQNGGKQLREGECTNCGDWLDNKSTKAAYNFSMVLHKTGLIQLVNKDHNMPSMGKNGRHCSLTDKQVEEAEKKRDEEKKKGNPFARGFVCEKVHPLEVELRLSQLLLYTQCAIELGILPICLNIAGSDDREVAQLNRKLYERGVLALSVNGLLHMQFFTSGRRKNVVPQLYELGVIVDELKGLIDNGEGMISALVKSMKSLVVKNENIFAETFINNTGLKNTMKGVGFDFEDTRKKALVVPQEVKWQRRFNELKSFGEKHGHTNVSTKKPKSAEERKRWTQVLGNWVSNQREQYSKFEKGKSSHMTKERIRLLNEIGFVWDHKEAAWQQKYEELKNYKEQHGVAHVSTIKPKTAKLQKGWNKALGEWVSRQRREYKKYTKGKHSQITAGRIEKLEKLEFKWKLV